MIRYEIQGDIAVITIDRPDVRNAVDVPTARELAVAFRRFDSDDSAKVAVLTGAGGTFCAGADLKAVAANGGFGATVLTALTAQNTLGVLASEAVSPNMVATICGSIEPLRPVTMK